MTDPTPPPPPQPPIDWEAIAAEVTQYGHKVVTRVGTRLEANAKDMKNGEYTADKLLDDIKAFWQAVADDVELGVDNWKKYVEHRGDGY